MNLSPLDFILTHTAFAPVAFVPEISLYQASAQAPLKHAAENWMEIIGTSKPFWAFPWPGGVGLARYVLDNPDAVRGKRVLDFAAGSGIVSIAAAKAGAARVMAADIDPLAQIAIQVNAGRNGAAVECLRVLDMDTEFTAADVILAGDVCYAQAMSAAALRWLYYCIHAGVTVLLSDPGRAYVPKSGLRELARYEAVPVLRELEDRDTRDVTVWRMLLPDGDDHAGFYQD